MSKNNSTTTNSDASVKSSVTVNGNSNPNYPSTTGKPSGGGRGNVKK